MNGFRPPEHVPETTDIWSGLIFAILVLWLAAIVMKGVGR